QQAQRILVERRAGGSTHTPLQVRAAAEIVVQLFTNRIVRDGVDREIAAGGGLVRTDLRMEGRPEVAMSHADLVVAAGHAKVPGIAFRVAELDDAETLPDQVDASARAQ